MLAALLYNTADPATFALFMALMVVFVLSLNGVGRALTTEDAERSPIARLFEAGRALHGARHVEELGARLPEMRPLLHFDDFYLVVVDREQGILDFRVHEQRGERMPRVAPADRPGLFGWVMEYGKPLLVQNWAEAPAQLKERAAETSKATGSLIAVPLAHEGEVIGLRQRPAHGSPRLLARRPQPGEEALRASRRGARRRRRVRGPRELPRSPGRTRGRTHRGARESERRERRLIAALREQSKTLERESREDALTGIANRRHFLQRLAAEFEVAKALGHPLTLAIADLDRFKLVNDDLGHG